jgi:multidrug efflux pump subunit AcrB
MDRIENAFDVAMRYVFEPGLNWVLQHPIVSVVVVVALVFWSVRGYRMM